MSKAQYPIPVGAAAGSASSAPSASATPASLGSTGSGSGSTSSAPAVYGAPAAVTVATAAPAAAAVNPYLDTQIEALGLTLLLDADFQQQLKDPVLATRLSDADAKIWVAAAMKCIFIKPTGVGKLALPNANLNNATWKNFCASVYPSTQRLINSSCIGKDILLPQLSHRVMMHCCASHVTQQQWHSTGNNSSPIELVTFPVQYGIVQLNTYPLQYRENMLSMRVHRWKLFLMP